MEETRLEVADTNDRPILKNPKVEAKRFLETLRVTDALLYNLHTIVI